MAAAAGLPCSAEVHRRQLLSLSRQLTSPRAARLRSPASAGRLLQGLNEDCQTIQSAIGDKVGMTIFNLSTALVGIIIGEANNG